MNNSQQVSRADKFRQAKWKRREGDPRMPVKHPFRTGTVEPGSVKHRLNRIDSAASRSSAGVATLLSF